MNFLSYPAGKNLSLSVGTSVHMCTNDISLDAALHLHCCTRFCWLWDSQSK